MPNGCQAIIDTREVRTGNCTDDDNDVYTVVASMACGGLEDVVDLAEQELLDDGFLGSGRASGRNRRETFETVASCASQQAIAICVECPWSTLKEKQEAHRLSVLADIETQKARALSAIADQQRTIEVIRDLTQIGQPDARSLLERPEQPLA